MHWLNFAVMTLLVVGHTALWIRFVNRTHALPWRCHHLRRIRYVHDVMVPVFPLVFFWTQGVEGPGLLWGGPWSAVSWPWRIVLAACVFGLFRTAQLIVWHSLTPAPDALIASRGQQYDIAADLGYEPRGHGSYGVLMRVPRNEQFRLEVTEKTLRIPRLPREWDGLTILHLSDWHFTGSVDRPYFLRVTEIAREVPADMVVFTGDLIDRMELVDWISATLGRFSAPLGCYSILGNHDWYLKPDEIRAALVRHGWIDVASRVTTIEHAGRTLALGGDETPWMGNHPDYSAAPADAFRLLLSHTPDNIDWAREQQIDLMLSGHNHGGQVMLPLVGPVYSPSKYGCDYAAGTFSKPPTVLHVSRGLSGQHPYRWRCLPEITRLTLRPAEIAADPTPALAEPVAMGGAV